MTVDSPCRLAEEPEIGGRISRPTVRAWYALAVVILATLFGFVDRQILILVTEPLKHEMHLTDAQIGLLQGLGPGVLASVGTIVLGWLADRTARHVVLAICVLLWSAATAAIGLAHSFPELILATAAIGLGEAAIGPVFYSMVPDLFPDRSRLLANLIFYGAITIGTGFGVSLSGSVIQWAQGHRAELPHVIASLSAWRIAFLLVALPGLPISLAIMMIGPVRRVVETTLIQPACNLKDHLRRNATALAGLCTAMGFYGIALYSIYAWTAPYIIRALGAGPVEVGYGTGAAFSVGPLLGVVLAGVLGKRLSVRFGLMTPVRLYQTSMWVALIPLLLLLRIDRPWQAYVLLGLVAAATTMGTALTPTLLQDLAPAALRGRIIAIVGLAYTSFSSLAPILTGALSDVLSSHPRGLLLAILAVSAPALLIAFGVLRLVERPLRRTIKAYSPSIES